MTDIEINRLCAEAIGRRETAEHYQPLVDDAQAMALVKKFNIVIERERTKELFAVTLFGDHKRDTYVVRAAVDLNRAICECVSAMQAAK